MVKKQMNEDDQMGKRYETARKKGTFKSKVTNKTNLYTIIKLTLIHKKHC